MPKTNRDGKRSACLERMNIPDPKKVFARSPPRKEKRTAHRPKCRRHYTNLKRANSRRGQEEKKGPSKRDEHLKKHPHYHTGGGGQAHVVCQLVGKRRGLRGKRVNIPCTVIKKKGDHLPTTCRKEGGNVQKEKKRKKGNDSSQHKEREKK